MTQKEFEQAPLKEKVYRVFEKGKEITSRQFLHFNIKLYTLYGFYVEVWYVPAANKIDRVETLSVDEILSIYKNQFDISKLLK